MLHQNFPNPFNATTTIKYSVAKGGKVSIKIYDILGRQIMTIVNEYKDPGYYTIHLNAEKFASGLYFYRMETGNYSNTRKFLLIK
jgi:hypothetical protein